MEGLALVNVHPDYLAFGERAARAEFPVILYEEFLAHVFTQFGGTAWCALPRDVAHFVRESVVSTARPPETTRALAEEVQ